MSGIAGIIITVTISYNEWGFSTYYKSFNCHMTLLKEVLRHGDKKVTCPRSYLW